MKATAMAFTIIYYGKLIKRDPKTNKVIEHSKIATVKFGDNWKDNCVRGLKEALDKFEGIKEIHIFTNRS